MMVAQAATSSLATMHASPCMCADRGLFAQAQILRCIFHAVLFQRHPDSSLAAPCALSHRVTSVEAKWIGASAAPLRRTRTKLRQRLCI